MKVKCKYFFLIFVFLIITLICGCGSMQNNGDGKDNNNTEQIKVGLLLPGSINDMGWNALAYEGLKKIEEDFGFETAYIESVKTSDMQEQFELLANQGYKVVFGHGFQFGDAAIKASENCPETFFVITSSNISQPPNVLSVNISNKQAGFVMGSISALLTESKTVGYIGGESIPSITDFGEGFEQGVMWVDSSVKPLITYIGSFDDAAKAKETAYAMIEDGADIITANANQAALGSIEACKEKGIKALGYPSDQSQAGDTIIVSGCENQPLLFSYIVKMAIDGNLEPKFYELGFKDNALYLKWNNEKIEDSIADQVNSIIDKLDKGEIVIK